MGNTYIFLTGVIFGSFIEHLFVQYYFRRKEKSPTNPHGDDTRND